MTPYILCPRTPITSEMVESFNRIRQAVIMAINLYWFESDLIWKCLPVLQLVEYTICFDVSPGNYSVSFSEEADLIEKDAAL